MKKLFTLFVLFLLHFNVTFADWKTDFDEKNLVPMEDLGDEYANLYGFNVSLNENGEYVLEYPKKRYDAIMRQYGGKNILGWDPSNTGEYKLNYGIEEKDGKVFLTMKKDENVKKIIKKQTKRKNPQFSHQDLHINDHFLNRYAIEPIGINLIHLEIYYQHRNSIEDRQNHYKYYIAFLDYFFYDRGDINEILKPYNDSKNKKNNEHSVGPTTPKIVNGNITFPFISSNVSVAGELEYIIKKYNTYYKKDIMSFTFPLTNKRLLKNFIWDMLYYDNFFMFRWSEKNNTQNTSEIIRNADSGDILLRLEETSNIKSWSFNVSNKESATSLHCSYYRSSDSPGKCYANQGVRDFEEGELGFDIDTYYTTKNGYIYFNISQLFFDKTGKKLGKKLEVHANFNGNNHNEKSEKFEYQNYTFTPKSDLLPLASQIKSPKTISKNPYLISINLLFALLYLLLFYFTSQLFNAYFEELSSKNKWNEKIEKTLHTIFIQPFQKLYTYIHKKTKKTKSKKVLENGKQFFVKYEHKIYIIIGFLTLGIIGQIVVDDFDIFSLKGWITIIIMIFILGFITLFKDMLLYISHKGKEKEALKLQNIPIGFIFASMVASFGRMIGLVPGVMFGTTIKVDTKKSITTRKLGQPKLLMKILFGAFFIGIVVWFLTIFFSPESFIYKFLIVIYFGIINDVFFSLLPFGLLWGVFIIKDKKIRTRWFLFTFIVFFFLLHTILHGEGDLNKLLQFNGSFLILVLILVFWMCVTGVLYYMMNKGKKR